MNYLCACKKGQLAEFRSYEGQEMQVKEKIVPLKVLLLLLTSDLLTVLVVFI